MNADMLQERWAQMRTEAQHRWNKLTDEDLDTVKGQASKLADVVGERYGYSRDKAQQQVDRFVHEYGAEIQETAGNWIGATRTFLTDHPWVGAIGLILVLGMVVGLIVRPRFDM